VENLLIKSKVIRQLKDGIFDDSSQAKAERERNASSLIVNIFIS